MNTATATLPTTTAPDGTRYQMGTMPAADLTAGQLIVLGGKVRKVRENMHARRGGAGALRILPIAAGAVGWRGYHCGEQIVTLTRI
jgi:hypothetical protein